MDEKLEKAIVEQAIAALWPKVREGDPKAVDRMLRLLERKEKPKRRYTMSAKALAQRRSAALKTGEHAQLPVNQALGKLEQEAATLEIDPGIVEAFESALEGDLAELSKLSARQLAALTALFERELAHLLREGLVLHVPVLEGDGEPVVDEDGEVVTRTLTNPRTDHVLRLAKLLGASFEDQRLTPKSRSEGELTEATADLRRFMLETYRRTEANRRDRGS